MAKHSTKKSLRQGPRRWERDGPAGPASDEAWTRPRLLALALLLAVAVLSLAWRVHPWLDVTTDGAIYIATARSLLAGEGYSYLGDPFIHRPPGFPVLLALVIAVFGVDFHALNLFVGLCSTALIGLLFVYTRPRLGTPAALALSAMVWLNPAFERLGSQVISDIPGATLLLLALVLERWSRRDPTAGREILTGLAVAAAAYVRSVNLLLVPAILLGRWLSPPAPHGEYREAAPPPRGPLLRMGALAAAAALLALLPWAVHSALNGPPVEHLQTRYYSYWVSMWNTDGGDPASPLIGPGELFRRLPVQIGTILPLLGSRMQSAEPTALPVLLGSLILGCWLFVLIRRRGPGEWFFGLALAALSIYRAFPERLILPFFLLGMAAVAETLTVWAVRTLKPRAARLAAAAPLGLLALVDLDPAAAHAAIAARHRRLQEVARLLDTRFPGDLRIAAPIGSHYAAFMDRPVYSFRPVLIRKGLPGCLAMLDQLRIDVIAISGGDGAMRALRRHLEREGRLAAEIGRVRLYDMRAAEPTGT